MTSIPFVPFDPRKIGPDDLVRDAYERGMSAIERHAPWSFLAIVGVFAVWLFSGAPFPPIPQWLAVAVLVGMVAALVAWPYGKVLASGLYSQDQVLLSQQDPLTGDQQLTWIAPDTWDDLTVINQNEEEKDRSYLKEVMINGERAYECDFYIAPMNVAIASWQAGASNSDIRANREMIKRIKTTLEARNDRVHELLAQNTDIVRDQVAEHANRIVQVAEGVEVPGEAQLHNKLTANLDERDVSDELMSPSGGDLGSDSELNLDGLDVEFDDDGAVSIDLRDPHDVDPDADGGDDGDD